MIKQVLVVRKDLNMRKGKIAAQAAHASMKVFLDRALIIPITPTGIKLPADWRESEYEISIEINAEMFEWLQGTFTKICVSCNSEAEIVELANNAKRAGLPCALILDSGKTEFHGVPTYTVLAVGPANSEAVDLITGGLPLL